LDAAAGADANTAAGPSGLNAAAAVTPAPATKRLLLIFLC
jgi:hypothetical protein